MPVFESANTGLFFALYLYICCSQIPCLAPLLVHFYSRSTFSFHFHPSSTSPYLYLCFFINFDVIPFLFLIHVHFPSTPILYQLSASLRVLPPYTSTLPSTFSTPLHSHSQHTTPPSTSTLPPLLPYLHHSPPSLNIHISLHSHLPSTSTLPLPPSPPSLTLHLHIHPTTPSTHPPPPSHPPTLHPFPPPPPPHPPLPPPHPPSDGEFFHPGFTALLYATSHSPTDDGCVAPTSDRQGSPQAALHKASLYGFSSLVRTFIDAGAEVDLQDRVGRTALIWACRRGQNKVIKDLLEAGADPNIRDRTGRDALSWAKRYKKDDSAELLLKYCPDLRLQESRTCGSSKVPQGPTNTSSTSPSPSAPPTPQDASGTRSTPSAAVIRDSEYTLKIHKDTPLFPTTREGTTPPSGGPQGITTASASPSGTHSDPKDNPHRPRGCGSSRASSAGRLAARRLLLLCLAVLWAGSS
ncbi:hypothetical protein C7M84_009722 [Penaeus vannamei]|uniref:Uncharacterized protein n=1 Tax=Penaeus vannamei TaxID=6689 RepID=A0A3R7PFN6_PENVA|nr:hypothetical protein C7M84_009722 [Penaeus vannamei]